MKQQETEKEEQNEFLKYFLNRFFVGLDLIIILLITEFLCRFITYPFVLFGLFFFSKYGMKDETNEWIRSIPFRLIMYFIHCLQRKKENW